MKTLDEVAQNIVRNDVYCCQSGFIEKCFEKGVLDFEEIDNLYSETDDGESEPQEVFEWWCVSKWLYEKLQAAGEPVITHDDFNHWWGRTTTGQSCYIDSVIRKIAKEI